MSYFTTQVIKNLPFLGHGIFAPLRGKLAPESLAAVHLKREALMLFCKAFTPNIPNLQV